MTRDRIRLPDNPTIVDCRNRLESVIDLSNRLDELTNPEITERGMIQARVGAKGVLLDARTQTQVDNGDVDELLGMIQEVSDAFTEFQPFKLRPLAFDPEAARASNRFGNAQNALKRRIAELEVENSVRFVGCLLGDPAFEDQVKAVVALRGIKKR